MTRHWAAYPDDERLLRELRERRRRPRKRALAPQTHLPQSIRRWTIVVSAAMLYSELGFTAPTTELARRADADEELVRRYIGRRDDVIAAVKAWAFGPRWDPLWEPPLRDRGRPLAERLAAFYRAYAEAYLGIVPLRLALWSALAGEPAPNPGPEALARHLLDPLCEELRAAAGLRGRLGRPASVWERELVQAFHDGIVSIFLRRHTRGLWPLEDTDRLIDLHVRLFLGRAADVLATLPPEPSIGVASPPRRSPAPAEEGPEAAPPGRGHRRRGGRHAARAGPRRPPPAARRGRGRRLRRRRLRRHLPRARPPPRRRARDPGLPLRRPRRHHRRGPARRLRRPVGPRWGERLRDARFRPLATRLSEFYQAYAARALAPRPLRFALQHDLVAPQRRGGEAGPLTRRVFAPLCAELRAASGLPGLDARPLSAWERELAQALHGSIVTLFVRLRIEGEQPPPLDPAALIALRVRAFLEPATEVLASLPSPGR